MGKIIASGGEDRIVSLWDVEEECFITSFREEHEGLIWNVVFSPDGQTLASGSDDGTIKLWKIDTDVDGNYVKHNFLEILCRPPELTKSRIWSVAFSPDSRTLASANHDGQIDFWEESNGKYEYKSEKNLKHDYNKKRVWSVAFSDNNTLVSSGDDGLVNLWDLNTRQSESIMSHSDWACAVAFNSQVTHIASCSKDSTIKIFDIKSKEIKSLEKPKLYEGLNITNISGLEKAQIDDLTKLGAQYDDK